MRKIFLPFFLNIFHTCLIFKSYSRMAKHKKGHLFMTFHIFSVTIRKKVVTLQPIFDRKTYKKRYGKTD